MPPLITCCCGFNLRVGTLIVGWMSLIYGILKIVLVNALGMSVSSSIESSIEGVFIDDDNQTTNTTTPAPPEESINFWAFAGMDFLLSLNIVMAVALITLTSMEKIKYLKWWVYVASVLSIISLLVFLFDDFFQSIVDIISFLIDMYGILVVYSFTVSDAAKVAERFGPL